MRTPALVVAGAVWAASPLLAQVHVTFKGGVAWSSALVKDFIVEEITVQPDPAPWLGVMVEGQFDHGFLLGLGVHAARSDLISEDPGTERRLTRLTLWSPFASIRREMLSDFLSVWGRLGLIAYDPSSRPPGSLFANETPTRVQGGLGITLEREIASRWHAGIDVSYDIHRFITDALRREGFRDPRTIHRVQVGFLVRYAATTLD